MTIHEDARKAYQLQQRITDELRLTKLAEEPRRKMDDKDDEDIHVTAHIIHD